jgi:hypothetical protein
VAEGAILATEFGKCGREWRGSVRMVWWRKDRKSEKEKEPSFFEMNDYIQNAFM